MRLFQNEEDWPKKYSSQMFFSAFNEGGERGKKKLPKSDPDNLEHEGHDLLMFRAQEPASLLRGVGGTSTSASNAHSAVPGGGEPQESHCGPILVPRHPPKETGGRSLKYGFSIMLVFFKINCIYVIFPEIIHIILGLFLHRKRRIAGSPFDLIKKDHAPPALQLAGPFIRPRRPPRRRTSILLVPPALLSVPRFTHPPPCGRSSPPFQYRTQCPRKHRFGKTWQPQPVCHSSFLSHGVRGLSLEGFLLSFSFPNGPADRGFSSLFLQIPYANSMSGTELGSGPHIA